VAFEPAGVYEKTRSPCEDHGKSGVGEELAQLAGNPLQKNANGRDRETLARSVARRQKSTGAGGREERRT